MANKYDNGKIYKLICDDGYYYIGSTIQKLNLRFNHHKGSAKTGTSRVYTYINNIGWDKIKIELVENYPCSIKSELNKREEYYINLSKNDELCLNFNKAYVSDEERKENMKKYYEANKDVIMEYHRKYNEENKETINKKRAEYRKENAKILAEKQRQYALNNIEQIKESKKKYNEENKEKLAEYWKEYAKKEENKERIKENKRRSAQKIKEENKEKNAEEREKKKQINEQKKQDRINHDRTIIKCSCGGSYQNYQKKRHEESKKHQKYLTI